jgi:hypothetical protein
MRETGWNMYYGFLATRKNTFQKLMPTMGVKLCDSH